MGKILTSAVLICLVSTNLFAEPTPLVWPKHRQLAERLSDGLVLTPIVLDTWSSFKSPDKKKSFTNQSCRMGLSIGANLLVKNLVHRERPDKSNNYSFYSGHTSNAMASGGLTFAIPVGLLRMGANKHYMSDVITGAVAGYLSTKLCRRD